MSLNINLINHLFIDLPYISYACFLYKSTNIWHICCDFCNLHFWIFWDFVSLLQLISCIHCPSFHFLKMIFRKVFSSKIYIEDCNVMLLINVQKSTVIVVVFRYLRFSLSKIWMEKHTVPACHKINLRSERFQIFFSNFFFSFFLKFFFRWKMLFSFILSSFFWCLLLC